MQWVESFTPIYHLLAQVPEVWPHGCLSFLLNCNFILSFGNFAHLRLILKMVILLFGNKLTCSVCFHQPPRRVRGLPWQHDLLEDSIRAAGITGIEVGTKLYVSNLDYGVTNEDIRVQPKVKCFHLRCLV